MLHERPDFRDLLVTVGDATGTNPALVEKDYWVTEALRGVAAGYSDGVVFKGGTSLSKGWGLIQRFSEDIDLLIRQDGSTGSSSNARDKYMKAIDMSVAEIDGLEWIAEGRRSERGISRTAVFTYEPRTALLEGLRPTIILEMGIRGGTHPTEQRGIRSILAVALAEADAADKTLSPFELTVLHPRRTLVEKLFVLNAVSVLWGEGKEAVFQRQGRHLYDVYFLLGDDDVAAFAGSDEYFALIPEIDELGRTYFPHDHRSPPEMRFATSAALAPSQALRAVIADDYSGSRFLFHGDPPTLDEIYRRIGTFRERL